MSFNRASHPEHQHRSPKMRSITLVPTRATLPRAVRARNNALVIQANTLWSLAPRQSKAQFFENSRACLDLTGAIGAHR